jgi:hypothetical protein
MMIEMIISLHLFEHACRANVKSTKVTDTQSMRGCFRSKYYIYINKLLNQNAVFSRESFFSHMYLYVNIFVFHAVCSVGSSNR